MNKTKSIIYALLAAVFYAVSVPFSKILMKNVGPTSMAALLARFTKPKNYDRFCKNAYAILNFDARPVLSKIKCSTYIMSGDSDNTVGNDAPYELKARIEHSEMFIFEGLDHGLFEEDKDFYNKVFEFCE